MDKVNMFNINFDNITFADLMEFILDAKKNKKQTYILTCNVDHVVQTTKDREFAEIYSNADLVVADGVPIMWASKLIKRPLKQKISGSDILPVLGKEFEKNEVSLFFLGAAEGIAFKAAENLRKKYQNIKIVGCYSPTYGFENNEEENEKILDKIKSAKPDVLMVGVGAPKQEKWIYKYYKQYDVPVSIGVGATFDFISGNVVRAPAILQTLGLEWFWRFLQEPKRLFHRYFIEDSKFIVLIIKELLKNKKAINFQKNEEEKRNV